MTEWVGSFLNLDVAVEALNVATADAPGVYFIRDATGAEVFRQEASDSGFA